MRLLVWNVHGCVGADRRQDCARIARVIARHAPDVVALQEVGDVTGARPPIDQTGALREALAMDGVLGVTVRGAGHVYGNLTLARAGLGITEWRVLDLSVPDREPRLCLVARVGPLHVANVHLGLSAAERLEQTRRLLDEASLPPAEAPLVVVGDFNDWPLGRATRALSARLSDAARTNPSRGARATFPSRFPVLRLDRAWVRGPVEPLAVHIDRSREARLASDHLPLVVDLRIADA